MICIIPLFDWIPVPAPDPNPGFDGIQSIQIVTESLDSGFHRSDDFLRVYQY